MPALNRCISICETLDLPDAENTIEYEVLNGPLPPIDLSLQKKWNDNGDTSVPEGAQATFELHRIKDVLPVMENGVAIGYVITFQHRSPITIYHGRNGLDGHTPLVGVKQADDGFWYWSLDGEWVLDTNGNKVLANAAGASVPKLKIEEDYWWVSYDSGTSWTKLGKAVGEQGGGDSMFREIRQDDHFVYFVLADGQEIKIAKGGGLSFEYV